jgi:hypothetical protein
LDLALGERHGTNAKIEILDRSTAESAVLSWRDPTGCCYGYQFWRKGIAKRMGICALSGTPIRRGDVIFRPGAASVRPANASAMILAAYIDSRGLAPSTTVLVRREVA